MVCSSSMKSIVFFVSLSSLMTLFMRSSNSPLYFVPASMAPRSRDTRRLPLRSSGISPDIILCANPSIMALFPTPGSPMSTGLFFVRRLSIWTFAVSRFAVYTGQLAEFGSLLIYCTCRESTFRIRRFSLVKAGVLTRPTLIEQRPCEACSVTPTPTARRCRAATLIDYGSNMCQFDISVFSSFAS